MIRALYWMAGGYLFGILGFGLASLASAWGTTDIAMSISDAFIFGLKWPATVLDLLTGNLQR